MGIRDVDGASERVDRVGRCVDMISTEKLLGVGADLLGGRAGDPGHVVGGAEGGGDHVGGGVEEDVEDGGDGFAAGEAQDVD